MKNKVSWYLVLMLLMASVFGVSGCSRLSGPSDAEAIKAITDSGAFTDLNMQAPVEVLEKGKQKKDGSWSVRVKITFTYEMGNKQMSAPMEKTPVYNLIKSKDKAGQTIWKVKRG